MKQIIYTANAPEPIGPYSQAIKLGNMLYTSGQIAINPKTNQLVLNSIEDETKQVMENIKAILDAAGMTFEHIIKCSIFIMNMNDFAAINQVYGSYFNPETAPARETVQVACLPKNVNIEISIIASF
ncbi:MAG: RidA family protein [Flavobacterium sp.]|jgi:2-iminobutanoate/2-iminopropanoate deaminase